LLALWAMVGWTGCGRAGDGGSANDDGGDYSDESGEQDPSDDMGGKLGTGPFGSADGFIEIKTTGKLAPQSLYEAQLCERLSP
jgi:hypothetical protein